MVFSTDENANKTVVCAGVPEKGDKSKQLKVVDWLKKALGPVDGKGGGGKGGLAQGQVIALSLSTLFFWNYNKCSKSDNCK